MSRSGYTDDCDDPLELGRWRAMVASAIRGKRGQKFLRELRDSLDAMDEKSLVASEDYELVNKDGDACALGSVALSRGWEDAIKIDSSDHEYVASRFDIAPCLVQEIEYENDDCGYYGETPQERWSRIRKWVNALIRS